MIAIVEFDHIGAKKIAQHFEEVQLVDPYQEIDLTSFDGIILSGAQYSDISYDFRDYSESLITELVLARVPILGICFGMQLLTLLFGGDVGEGEEQGWTVATLDIQDDLLSGYMPKEQVLMTHIYEVTEVPSGFKIIATTPKDSIAGIRNESLPIWGVMWHPELMHKRGGILFKSFEELCL